MMEGMRMASSKRRDIWLTAFLPVSIRLQYWVFAGGYWAPHFGGQSPRPMTKVWRKYEKVSEKRKKCPHLPSIFLSPTNNLQISFPTRYC